MELKQELQKLLSNWKNENIDNFDLEFIKNHNRMMSSYEKFKESVEKARESGETCLYPGQERPALIEVIRDKTMDENDKNQVQMPLLVHVSREKRPNYHHNFKAGAINVLYGLDGLRGPVLSGTGFYLKRESLYKTSRQEGRFQVPICRRRCPNRDALA
ncbi:hypothetical protein IFM89_012085 [Coptis chinensis]|uniref:Uncharacterized protein n=1 Tax=Coptis chinensis TaxID=261450 RepID=A0A835LXR4_9MAGN|nr:hypothetical protein IFM89_012085 [Coptis chinensis]